MKLRLVAVLGMLGLLMTLLASSAGATATPQAPAAKVAATAAVPAGTHTVAEEAAACAALYSVSVSIGPDLLGPCQWDMRIIGASPTGSYAINQGEGVTVGIIDTGIDLTHPDLLPNLDVG